MKRKLRVTVYLHETEYVACLSDQEALPFSHPSPAFFIEEELMPDEIEIIMLKAKQKARALGITFVKNLDGRETTRFRRPVL